MTHNHEVYKKYVHFRRRCVILGKSWRWQYTGVPWLFCRNRMRDPVVLDCMYGVEKTAVKCRLENCDKVDKYFMTSPLDWLNLYISFPKLFVNQLHYLVTPPHIWMRKWDEMAKLNICDNEVCALDTEFNLTLKGCLWQDQTNFVKHANEPFQYDFESEEGFTFCAFPPFNTLSTEKLKRDSGSSEENLQVVVVEGGTTSQRRLLFWLMLLLLLRKK